MVCLCNIHLISVELIFFLLLNIFKYLCIAINTLWFKMDIFFFEKKIFAEKKNEIS